MGSEVSPSTSVLEKIPFDLSAPPPQYCHQLPRKHTPYPSPQYRRVPASFLISSSSWALCSCTPSDLISSAYAELPRQATALHVEFHPMPVSPACSTWPQVTTNGVRLPACSYGLISGFITSGSAPVFPGLLPCSPFEGTGHAPVSQRR